MQVRRAATVTGAVAALVLLGAPAWADETPAPEPTGVVVDDGGLADDPDCVFYPAPTDQPTGEVTAEPGETVTAEPVEGGGEGSTGEGSTGEGSTGDATTVEATDQPTDEPTGTPTDEPTDQPTSDPTDEPTGTPTDEPTDLPTDEPTDGPDGYWACMSAGTAAEGPLAGSESGDPTLGSGTLQLPFSGAPVGRYAATGFALLIGGAGIVLVARRRVS